MALNLFSKTHLAYHSSDPSSQSSSTPPEFLYCEQDDRRAAQFLGDIRQRGGSELASRVLRVGSGREWVYGLGIKEGS